MKSSPDDKKSNEERNGVPVVIKKSKKTKKTELERKHLREKKRAAAALINPTNLITQALFYKLCSWGLQTIRIEPEKNPDSENILPINNNINNNNSLKKTSSTSLLLSTSSKPPPPTAATSSTKVSTAIRTKSNVIKISDLRKKAVQWAGVPLQDAVYYFEKQLGFTLDYPVLGFDSIESFVMSAGPEVFTVYTNSDESELEKYQKKSPCKFIKLGSNGIDQNFQIVKIKEESPPLQLLINN